MCTWSLQIVFLSLGRSRSPGETKPHCLPTKQAFFSKTHMARKWPCKYRCAVITGGNLFSAAYACNCWTRIQPVPVDPGRMVAGPHLASVNADFDRRYMTGLKL